MRTLRIAAITAALLALATGDALAHFQTGRGQAGRMHGPGAQVRGGGQVHGSAPPTQLHPGLRSDGRSMHDGRFANDPRFATHRFGHDGRFAHGGRVHGGHFVHGFHGGHVGWWMVSGGVWYPWPQYAAVAPAYVAPAYMTVWYYCQSVGAYFPSVTDCAEGWLAVVVAPT